MSKNKPDKELNRLRHELDNEREKNQEARRQLKLKDNELDTAEKLENKIKGQTFEVEIEILRKELASSKETVRILKAHDKETYEKSSQEFFRIMSSYQDVLRAFQEKHPVTAGAFGENDPATALAGDEVDDDGDLESRDDNQELAVLQINNSMQRMMMRDLKESNKEDAEEHEKEIKAISQELENLKENLANTTKSYDDLLETHNLVSKKYDDLVEATKERDSVPTGSDHEQLLENHNGLTRDYAARIQEIDDLTLLHHEELDLYVEYLLKYVSPPKPQVSTSTV